MSDANTNPTVLPPSAVSADDLLAKLLSTYKKPAKGAKPTANALQFARTRGHKEIEHILVSAGAKE